MNESKKFEVPQADMKDIAHTGATVLLSAIPFLGAGELFKATLTPPLEKRRDQWMATIAQAVEELQQKSGITPQSLSENEEFISLLIEASQIAWKTHLEEKRKAVV